MKAGKKLAATQAAKPREVNRFLVIPEARESEA